MKRAYKREAQRTHPDRNGGNEESFKAVQQAYELLSNADRRRHYDETGDRAMKRIRRRSPGPNVFADELASRIADLDKQLERKAADIREAEDAAKFLDDYEYDLITPVRDGTELPQAALLRWNKEEA